MAMPFDLQIERISAPDSGGLRVGLRADSYEDYGWRVSPYAGLTVRAAPTPETAWSVDAGAKLAAGPLGLDAGYFHRDATNLIDFVRTPGDPVFHARNVLSAVTDGIEVSAAWERGRPPFISTLSVQAAWIFADLAALSASAGGAAEGRYVLDPLHVKADATIGLALPASLGLTARLTYFSRPSFADGVWLLSSRLAWQAFQGRVLELFLEGENLGNVRYEDVPGVPLPGRTALAGFNLTW